ncbi:MAG: Uma2 family endonuclease [Roseiflexaceae bacterium]
MTALVIPTEAPRVEGPPQGRWTYNDWERLPDDGNRYEVISGCLYMTTAPSNFHQWIIQNLYDHIGFPLKQQGLGYSFFAPIGVLMPGCEPVQPDFVVVLKANAGIIQNRRIRGVPDIIVEVLSPGNADYDREIKREAYERAGVPEYAMIDPTARTLTHYCLTSAGGYGPPQQHNASATFAFVCLPALALPVAALFEGSPDTAP